MEVGWFDHAEVMPLMAGAPNFFCKSGDDLIHGRGNVLSIISMTICLLDEAFLFAQVFERRSAADPCQKRGESVLRRAQVKMRNPRHPANFVKVEAPV